MGWFIKKLAQANGRNDQGSFQIGRWTTSTSPRLAPTRPTERGLGGGEFVGSVPSRPLGRLGFSGQVGADLTTEVKLVAGI